MKGLIMVEESAFPIFDKDGMAYTKNCGLTKREWYAGLAMQGILAHGYASTPRDTREYVANEISKGAFEIADAMIEKSKRK